MIIVHGVFTLTAPLHSSDGLKGLRVQRDGKVSHQGRDGIPVVSTVTMPLTVRGRFHGDLPIFPASGIVGRLRRNAAQRYRAALTSDGAALSQAVYYAITNGHPVGAQTGSTYTLEAYREIQAQFFFGVLGGGSLRHPARYVQHDLIPVTALTIDAGLVPEKFSDLAPVATGSERELEPWQMLTHRVIRKIDDISRGRDTTTQLALPENGDEKFETAVAYQAIPAGTSMYLRMAIEDNTTPAQRGLVLLALRDLCNGQQLGGRIHLGWGGFKPQRFRMIHGDRRIDLFDLASDDEGIAQLVDSDSLEELLAPALTEIELVAKQSAAAREALHKILRT